MASKHSNKNFAQRQKKKLQNVMPQTVIFSEKFIFVNSSKSIRFPLCCRYLNIDNFLILVPRCRQDIEIDFQLSFKE